MHLPIIVKVFPDPVWPLKIKNKNSGNKALLQLGTFHRSVALK